jgi:metal-responsive CopG/Arc/MetJ family transcriptional regulator
MAGENKDTRVVIMMSQREVAAVDQWRFENHIGSRGEAIRQLIRKGFMADYQDTKRAKLDDQ